MEAVTKVDWHDALAKTIVAAAAQDFAMDFAHDVQTEAQRIVPHKDGTLEGSAVTEPLGGGEIGARISFGGPAELYAAVQHEEMMEHPNGRQWKYLETPFKAKAPLFPEGLELTIRLALKGGG